MWRSDLELQETDGLSGRVSMPREFWRREFREVSAICGQFAANGLARGSLERRSELRGRAERRAAFELRLDRERFEVRLLHARAGEEGEECRKEEPHDECGS